MPEAFAYIDGLNLYYGALRNRPALKWVNPHRLLERLLPGLNVERIRYFSTLAISLAGDPERQRRQAVYFRALRTIPSLTIHEGRMAIRTKTGIMLPKSSPTQVATLEVFEEKRTDVNIASHLLLDAFEGRYDTAVIVSNDSDLTTPIEMVVNRLGKRVITVNPYRANRQSSELRLGRITRHSRNQHFRLAGVPIPRNSIRRSRQLHTASLVAMILLVVLEVVEATLLACRS